MSDAPGPAAPAAPPDATDATDDSRFSNTIILTYDNHVGPLDNIVVDLTDYFWTISTETMHTYKYVKDIASFNTTTNDYSDSATIVDTPLYKKTYVSRTEDMLGIKSNLMIIIAHGKGYQPNYPPCIQFFDQCQHGGLHYDDLILYADSQKMLHKSSTPMKLVTSDCDLLILFCCYSNQIVPLYLADLSRDVHKPRLPVDDKGNPIHSPKRQKTHHTAETRQTRQTQDVVFLDYNEQLVLCGDIVMLLMISMADSDHNMHGLSPAQRVKPIILRIMQMVRLFDDDADSFWSFLEAVGCVVLLENVKEMQQQSNYWQKNKYFRVGGHKLTIMMHDTLKKDLLAGLRSLTLVTWTSSAGVDDKLTSSVKGKNPPDIQFNAPAKDGSDKHVDEFLRNYQKEKKYRQSLCTVSAAAPAEPLLALLAQLRALDVEKKRTHQTFSP